jgi:histidinol-phosphate aminotransferase
VSQEILALNRNENFFPHHPAVVRALAQSADSASRYAPKELQAKLHNSLADYLNILPHTLALGHGGEDLLVKILAWLRKERSQLVRLGFSWHTYVEIAEGLGYSVHTVPHAESPTTFSTPAEVFSNHLSQLKNPSVVILTTPNNPTGHATHPEVIHKLATRFPMHTFLVDVVYDIPRSQHLPAAIMHSNVILIGSFSKFFGLPGIRLGYAIGQNLPKALQLALGFSESTLNAGLAALSHAPYYQSNRDEMLAFAKHLAARSFSGLRVFETTASLVLVEIENPCISADLLEKAALETQVRPKVFSEGSKRFLRWGLGPSAVNQRIEKFMETISSEQ